MTRKEAEQFIADLIVLREGVTDQFASLAPSVYPKWETAKDEANPELIKAGTRFLHDGRIVKVTVDVWNLAQNSPENSPTLYEELEYRDGVRVIPDIITVTKAFALDELGWWNDAVYKSRVSANVYTPEQYPANWELVSGIL